VSSSTVAVACFACPAVRRLTEGAVPQVDAYKLLSGALQRGGDPPDLERVQQKMTASLEEPHFKVCARGAGLPCVVQGM
jgi:hypothetical protein